MSRLRRQPWNRWVPRTIFARILVSGLLGTCLLVYILLSALGRHHPVPDVIPVLEKAVSYEKTGKVSDLRPRAGDTSYTGQITTGRMLFCLLQNPNADQSTWTYDDLDTWGWEEFEISAHKISDYQNDYILDAYNDLGINTSDDIGRAYGGLEPYPKTAPEEDQQEETTASYENLVNSVAGSIVAMDNYSPTERLRDDGRDVADVPALNKWSDVVALEWQKYASGGADLSYVFRANIQNENTKEIILSALMAMGRTEVPLYPGVTVEVDASGTGQYSDSFFALLGTYHGAGPAYLLAQHRSLFGGRVILKVQVWSKGYTWRTDGSSGLIDNFNPSAVFFVSAI